MIRYIELDSDNCRILSHSTAPFQNLEELLRHAPGGNYRLVDSIQFPQDSYWDGSRVVSMPEKPSSHHSFNYQSRLWEVDLDTVWASVRSQRSSLLAESDWVRLREWIQENLPHKHGWITDKL